MLSSRTLTECEIEDHVARYTDRIDAAWLSGGISDEDYDLSCASVKRWAENARKD